MLGAVNGYTYGCFLDRLAGFYHFAASYLPA
jgi:hypothetical protein